MGRSLLIAGLLAGWVTALGAVVKSSVDRLSASPPDEAGVSQRRAASSPAPQPAVTLRTRDKAVLLLKRLAESRPFLLGAWGFYAFLAVTYLLILTSLILYTARLLLEEKQKGHEPSLGKFLPPGQLEGGIEQDSQG